MSEQVVVLIYEVCALNDHISVVEWNSENKILVNSYYFIESAHRETSNTPIVRRGRLQRMNMNTIMEQILA